MNEHEASIEHGKAIALAIINSQLRIWNIQARELPLIKDGSQRAADLQRNCLHVEMWMQSLSATTKENPS